MQKTTKIVMNKRWTVLTKTIVNEFNISLTNNTNVIGVRIKFRSCAWRILKRNSKSTWRSFRSQARKALPATSGKRWNREIPVASWPQCLILSHDWTLSIPFFGRRWPALFQGRSWPPPITGSRLLPGLCCGRRTFIFMSLRHFIVIGARVYALSLLLWG